MMSHESIASSHDIFMHIRIIVGMVLGISVTRIVTGLTRFVQHQRRYQIYPLHLGWVIFVLLFIIHFWWFEFSLARIQKWTFLIYCFLLSYAGVFTMLAAMLFPERMDEYKDFHEYFQKSRRGFYGILLALFLLDVIDTLIKGHSYYLQYYGWDYPVRQALLIVGTVGAIFIKSEKYQSAFVIFALLFQVIWIVSRFEVMR